MARFMRVAEHGKLQEKEAAQVLVERDFSLELIQYSADYYGRESVEVIGRNKLEGPYTYWINLIGIHNEAKVEELMTHLQADPFLTRIVIKIGQRARLEQGSDYLFLTLRMLNYQEDTMEIDQEQVSFFLKGNTVVTFQEKPGDVFGEVRRRLAHNNTAIRHRYGDFLLYALVDAIVQHHFLLLEKIEDRIEQLEDEILRDQDTNLQGSIQKLRRDMLLIKTSIWPLRETVCSLSQDPMPLLSQFTRDRLRDTDSQTNHIIDLVTAYREMITGIYDTYLSNNNRRLNRVVTTLTVISTIFIPLTFLTGVYGMNFTYMPEIDWPYAYGSFWIISLGISGGMLSYFRKKKWI
jgi:magnesium transporter